MGDQDFWARAERLGHSAELLRAGQTVRSVIDVANMDELRALLNDGSGAGPQVLAAAPAAAGEDGDAGLMSRVQAFVHGAAELAADDLERIAPAFPLTVTAESAAGPQTYNGRNVLATSAGPLVLNYAQVTFDDKAYVVVYNTPLTFACDSIVRNGGPPAGWGDFNILGATGGTGRTGDGGPGGSAGTDGINANCSMANAGGTNGATGTAGGTGATGGQGGTGLASMITTITVTHGFSGAPGLYVLTRSGTGGAGGAGGMGGTGGAGGKGGDGVTCLCTGLTPGNGAPGGPGGPGGIGGTGGAPADAVGGIFVRVPAAQVASILPLPYPAPAGPGGAGGAGGAGGTGGAGGAAGKHNSNGTSGAKGSTGPVGADGAPGPGSGIAATITVQPL